MSETYLETMGLHNIDSIDITNSNLGQGINDRFENIGYNFNKILKSEYLRGHSGSNMSTVICEISDSTDVIEDVFYYSKNSGNQVQLTNVSGVGIKNLIGSKLINHYNVDHNWIDKIFQKTSTIYFITENDSQGNKYIKASLPYYIIDPDFVDKYKNLYNTNDVESATNFIDRSCVVYFDTQNEDGCLEVKIYNNIPTIYYDTVVKDFCWRINGERTGISAKGIPGQQGLKGSSFLLGQFKYSETNTVDGYNELFSIYMVNNSGVGKWYEVNNEEQMKELLGITNLDHGSPIIAIGLTEDTVQSNTLTTKLVLGVLHISTGEGGKSQYNIAYNSSNMDIGSIISRTNYFESLYDSDSLFLNSRDKNKDIVKVTVDNNEYNLGHFIKPSINDSQGKHVLSVGLNMYNYSNPSNTKIPTSIMGTDSKIYVEDVPNNITSVLDVNYNELNCKDIISSGQLIVKKGLTAGADVNISKKLNVAGNITTESDLDVSNNAIVRQKLTVGSSGSFGGDLSIGGKIGNTISKTPLRIYDGIYIYNTKTSPETMPIQMWQPDNGRYNIRFNDSYVYLQGSHLHVSGSSGAGDIGIHSEYNIKTKNQLIAEDGINVGIKTDGRKINLLGPVQLGKSGLDKHSVDGDLIVHDNLTVHKTVEFLDTLSVAKDVKFNNTLTVAGKLIVNGGLSSTGNTTVNKLTVNNDAAVNKLTVGDKLIVNGDLSSTGDTTLGKDSSHEHTINGKIVITDWVATDEMIENIFN